MCDDGKMDTDPPARYLPKCAIESCPNKVYCDPDLWEGMQEFNYCSPSCRDKHLLSSNFDETKREIRQFEVTFCMSRGHLERLYADHEGSVCSTCLAAPKTVAASSMKDSNSSRTTGNGYLVGILYMIFLSGRRRRGAENV